MNWFVGEKSVKQTKIIVVKLPPVICSRSYKGNQRLFFSNCRSQLSFLTLIVTWLLVFYTACDDNLYLLGVHFFLKYVPLFYYELFGENFHFAQFLVYSFWIMYFFYSRFNVYIVWNYVSKSYKHTFVYTFCSSHYWE